MAPAPRLAFFIGLSAALVLAALLFGPGGGLPSPAHHGPARAPSLTSKARRPAAESGDVRKRARGFLNAFTRSEVGDCGPAVTAALRATATVGFAADLLRERPSTSDPSPADPVVGPISVVIVSTDPPLASVGAVAYRPSGPEQLAFLFARRGRGWLASAPGE